MNCPDGQTSLDGLTCTECLSNTYCQAGVLTSCPAHSTSLVSSSLISQCNCDPGFFRTNMYQCIACPAGSRCTNNHVDLCASGSYSDAGSTECTVCAIGTFESSPGSPACETCPGGLTVLKTTEFNELFDPSLNRSTVPPGQDNVYIMRGFLTQSQENYITKWSFFASSAGCVVTPMIFGATVFGNQWEGNVQFDVLHVGTTRTVTQAGANTFKYSDDNSAYYVRAAVPSGTPYLNAYEFFAWAFTGPSCIPYDLADMNTHFYSMEFPVTSTNLSTASYIFAGSTYSAPKFWSVRIVYEHRAMISSTVSTGTNSVYDCKCPSNTRQLSDGNCQGLCENGKYMLHETDNACTICPQGSKCSRSIMSACQSGYSSLRESTVCSPCPGPGTHTNIALYMCGLLTTCAPATLVRLGSSSSWYGSGKINVGTGGASGGGGYPSTPWFPGSLVVGLILNSAIDRPRATLRRKVAVSVGVPIAFQFRYMCTGSSCNSAAFSVLWSENDEYTTIFSMLSVPASTMASASWVQSSTDFITPSSNTEISVQVVAEMNTSSAVVWLASFEVVSLGQWTYDNIANLKLLDTTNIQVPHSHGYSETVESSTLQLSNHVSISQPFLTSANLYSGYPYKVSVWAQSGIGNNNNGGTLNLSSSGIDFQTWTTTSTLTQYVMETTVLPEWIKLEITGSVVISRPSMSLRTLDIGCQSCLQNHWCSTQFIFECPQNSLSVAGSSSQDSCYCRAGYYGKVTAQAGWTPCSQCDTNHFCTGGNFKKLCPDGSKSDPGSVHCTICSTDEVCKGGQVGNCSLNSHGPPNASDISECVCNDGYYGNAPDCVRCEPGSYCYGGNKHACTASATSTAGAVNSTECFCDRGYYGLHNAPCTPCEEGSWCWTGIKNACPAHMWSAVTSNFPGNCTCDYGYTLSAGGGALLSCIPCSAGSYKTTRGFTECTLCYAGTFSPTTAAKSASACAVCDVGHFSATPGQFQCQACSPGYYTPLLGSVDCMPCWLGSYALGGAATCTGCSAGSMSSVTAAQSSSVCTACPVGSWSPGNTSNCNICGVCTYWHYPRTRSFLVNSMTSVFDRSDSRIHFALHPYDGKVYMAAATSVYVVDMTTKTVICEIVVQGPGRVWWFACLATSQLGNYLYAIQSTYVFRVDLDMNAQWDLVYPSSSATCVVEDVTKPDTPLIWIAQLDGVRSMNPEQALVLKSYAITGSNYICLSPIDTENLYVTGSFGLKRVVKTTGVETNLLSNGAAYTVCRFTPDGLFLILSNAATKTAWAYSILDGGMTKILNNAAVSGIITDSNHLVFGVDTVGVRNISYSEMDSATCGPGKYSQYSGLQLESQCSMCPSGSLCPGGSNITQCIQGTYSTSTGLREQGQCSICNQGYYCTGGAAKHVCPLGSYSELTGVSAEADCPPCPSGYFCPNTTASIRCPANTMSATGSSDLGQCLCAPGYSCIIVMVVHAEIILPITRAEFTSEMQQRYIMAIALAAGVSVEKVRIVSISETVTGNRRRLLGLGANAVEVHTSIYDSQKGSVDDLNAHLRRHGLPSHRGILITIHKEVVGSFRID